MEREQGRLTLGLVVACFAPGVCVVGGAALLDPLIEAQFNRGIAGMLLVLLGGVLIGLGPEASQRRRTREEARHGG